MITTAATNTTTNNPITTTATITTTEPTLGEPYVTWSTAMATGGMVPTTTNEVLAQRNRNNSPRRIKTTWVSFLTKGEVEAYLKEQGMDYMGKLDELRKRFSTFINGGNYPTEISQRLLELEQRHTSTTSGKIINDNLNKLTTNIEETEANLSQKTEPGYQEAIIPTLRIEDRTFDRVRTWMLQFDGKTDPIDFIDRVEELAWIQQIPLDQIPYTLSESFHGIALAWWRNRRREWSGWSHFKQAFLKYFLPTNFWDNLEEAVQRRQQNEGEPFKEFTLALESLMRHTQLSPEQKLERIYKNSLPALRLLIKRAEFNSLDALTDLVSHIELTRGSNDHPVIPTLQEMHKNLQPEYRQHQIRGKPTHTHPPKLTSPASTPKYVTNPQTACARCGQQGHHARECTKRPLLFCWTCGKIGTRTIQCCRAAQTQLRGVRVRKPQTTAPPNNLLTIHNVRCNKNSLLATVSINNQSWQGILDTGSWHSFVNAKVAARIHNPATNFRPCNFTVTLANGQCQSVTQRICVTLNVGGTQHQSTLLILPNATDSFIFGMDVLAAVGTTLKIGDVSVEVNNLPKTTQLCTISQISTTLDAESQQFLDKELALFKEVNGVSNLPPHKIVMRDDRPIKQRYYPRNPAQQAIIHGKIHELLERDLVEPSKSPYSAAVVLVRKKNDQWRMCIDYRQLNEKSIPDAYPLPRIQHILDLLRNARVISSLDLKDGYWQIQMHPDSKQYTAFTVPGMGLYQWKVMPFGLHSAPATFQRGLDQVIGNDLEPSVFAYLDDIIVHTSTIEGHRQVLGEVFLRLRQANLQINPGKCEVFRNQMR